VGDHRVSLAESRGPLGEDAETGGVSPSGGKKQDKQYKTEFLGDPFFHHSDLSSEFRLIPG
jgi:hypothetical protein